MAVVVEFGARRAPAAVPGEGRDHRILSFDGLRLHVREEGPSLSPHTPIFCLPGLTRSMRDFRALATHLSTLPRRPRRVIAMDYRGRGRSEYDRNWRNYSLMVEMRDCLDVATALGLDRFALIGTSRGGLIAMAIALYRPGVLAGVVFNDVGPEIGWRGLARIKGVLATMHDPRSWDEAADMMRRFAGQQFTGLDDAGWLAFARATFRDENGRPMVDFDRAILNTLEGIDFERKLPTLWPQFGALKRVPALVVRGGNSDLLLPETVARMMDRHPRIEAVTVPDVGHAPSLMEPEALNAVTKFVSKLP